ncbi:membrane-bound lytic murein transglycosylase A [Chitinivorax tropicus]|uniref:peptidoglycan lytic exotransglycosylase n=1 Tax=Chitinivorax tropicus TaxID=714531 RepID=A0A840MVQ9_9PROT|nr:membrane-bound lytic murein transglycosylase A [Chitinivorax tropicus]
MTETKPEPAPVAPTLQRVSWGEVVGWPGDLLAPSFEALLQSCKAIARRPGWGEVCEAAKAVDRRDGPAMRRFYETRFVPLRVANADGSTEGLITGYYEPLLNGALTRDERHRFPLYGVPDDLLTIDLGEVYPDLKGLRLRGRIEGRKVVPYYSREQIEKGAARLGGKELAWVDDEVEAFFLQIQGSGRIKLPDGRMLRVNYADQNGHPYKAIGKTLIDRGELPPGQASMQAIQAWALQNPDKLAEILNSNPSFIFFRTLPNKEGGPQGALGVPLTDAASVAVDPKFIPLGAPVFLATNWPNTDRPLHRLMLAQDTGGAIRGAVRADFFWGFGKEAGQQAGRMKQRGKMWVLLPQEIANGKGLM